MDNHSIQVCNEASHKNKLLLQLERLWALMTDHFWGHFFRGGYSSVAARLELAFVSGKIEIISCLKMNGANPDGAPNIHNVF